MEEAHCESHKLSETPSIKFLNSNLDTTLGTQKEKNVDSGISICEIIPTKVRRAHNAQPLPGMQSVQTNHDR